MMESARLRTEFYSSPPDGKWPHDLQQMADVISVDVNTCEEYFIDDLVDFDTSLEQTSHKMSSPVYRSHHVSSRPLYIASKPMDTSHPTLIIGSHPVIPIRTNPVMRISSLDERVFDSQNRRPQFSRLREALTSANQQIPFGSGRLSDPVMACLPIHPVQCTRCGGELNSKCLVQACTKPDQTTCKVCGNEMNIKCILAVCKQELEAVQSK